MPKITMIGAGSTVFAMNLTGDILSVPELANSEIALMDIDAGRLEASAAMVRKKAEFMGANPTITTHQDRKSALEGADYVINMIQVGGYEPCTVTDFEIPKKYGLKQTIADTLGIGGIFRALRTVPVLLDMCKDMEAVCPDTMFLNYVNPMAINTGAILKSSKIRTVGLCHGIQGSINWLGKCLDIPHEEITFLAGGTNHMAYFVKLEHKGENLYPRLFKLLEEGAECTKKDAVRFEMMRRFGYYGGESSEHTAEYIPYFIRKDHEELIERFGVPIDEYLRRCVRQIESWDDTYTKLMAGEGLEHKRSQEYASYIIHAMETGQPTVIYGNVLNKGYITNLPPDCCVEVPCLVDGNGVQPTTIGDLPHQCAALVRTQVNVQELTIQACLTGKKEYVYHAAALDPHTAAELSLDEIWSLVDDLFEAHGDWIPPMH